MKVQNTIYIIGAGAIGKSLAVFLKEAAKQVLILRGSVDDGSSQTERIRVEAADGIHEAEIEVATLSSFDCLQGIIVLANKSYGNERLATILQSKAGSSPVVLFQNGLGVEKPFMTDEFKEIYRCVLFVTSQSIDQTFIRFKPVDTCPIGIEKGNTDTLARIVQELSTPYFRFRSEEDIQQIIWRKAIVNSVFNSVCPLLEVDNGIFQRNADALEIARTIISECVAVAKIKGIMIDTDEVEESLLKISKSSDGQIISTLQDIFNKRRTEIDTLNLEIVHIAENIHTAYTVNNTKLLGKLVKLKADANLREL
ncbi:MAG: 2-dehydropantoate 2-reductase [Williamsia sp.]|nr:2-dehydropantoate 2-reductase [Williamsia sp.]